MKSSELKIGAVYMVTRYGYNYPAVFIGIVEENSKARWSDKKIKKAKIQWVDRHSKELKLDGYSSITTLASIDCPIADNFESYKISQQISAARIELARAEAQATRHKFQTLLVKKLGNNSGKVEFVGQRISVELSLEELEALLTN